MSYRYTVNGMIFVRIDCINPQEKSMVHYTLSNVFENCLLLL